MLASRPGRRDDAGAAADSLVKGFLRVVAPDLPPDLARESVNTRDVVAGTVHARGGLRILASSASATWRCRALTVALASYPKMARASVDTQLLRGLRHVTHASRLR